ncbi:MAG: hypothetical protein SFV15_21510 [Polyangiaceae bacterium]|nr:hypothetical protein [Polyangiaceae bacterium]
MNSKIALVFLVPLTLTACPREQGLTGEEAREAVQESALSSEAEGLTASAVDLSTHFTIGQGVQAAADELKTFVSSQLPCAAISATPGTLSVTYGANPGNCVYRGHTYRGQHTMSVSKNEMGSVVVNHTWDKLSNGKIEVSGTATVTWNFNDQSRHVVHSATWRNLSTGLSAEGSGDRVQTVLAGGLGEGIQVDGSRTWKGPRGTWDLAIDGVQMRWIDPVPQAGSYTLHTPSDKSATLSFSRVDANTIAVTVSSGRGNFKFNVTALGIVE